MRIKIHQFLLGGTLLSWSYVGLSLGRSLIKMGHDVEFVSTDGVKEELTPEDIKPFIKNKPTGIYDAQISYTMMKNFPSYLGHGKKNRFGIYNYDASHLPPDMVKYHKFCDYLCPSSNFSASIFEKAKIPKDKIKVIPHGIDVDQFQNNKDKYRLDTDKKIKILWNIASPHLRKNIKNTLRAYGEAFTNKDDVCLVIKVNTKYTQKTSKVDFFDQLKKFKRKYKNYGEILIINDYLPSLIGLYNACDIVLMLSNFEQWGLPASDGLAAGKIVVASNYGGQLHFLNKKNSLLVDGDVVRMPRKYFYWNPQVKHGEMFDPSIEDSVEKLRQAAFNYDEILDKLKPHMEETVNEFTWDNAAKKLMDLVE